MTPIPLALLLLLGLGTEITVDAENGELIDRPRTFKVGVVSDKPVTQVEFYVGEELRDSDTSIPYEFSLDPLNEKDGDLAVKFVAYNEDGEAGSKTIRVRLDSGLSKGADFHFQRARDLFARADWNEAIRAGQIVLRVDKNHVPARLLMARAYFWNHIYDKAQQLAEDALALEPNNRELKDLLIAVNLRKAFSAASVGTDRAEAYKNVKAALTNAVNSRRELLRSSFDALGAPTDANRLRYADAAIRIHKYNAAIQALDQPFRTAPTADVANRLAYARARQGQPDAALHTLDLAERARCLDAYGWALRSMLLAHKTDMRGSMSALDAAVKAESQMSAAVAVARVYYSMMKGDVGAIRNLATQTVAAHPADPVAQYYKFLVFNRLGEQSGAERALEESVLLEPGQTDAYVEAAGQQLNRFFNATKKPSADEVDWILKYGEMYVDAALAARPESPEALVARSFIQFMRGKPNDTYATVNAALRVAPDYAPAHYTAASVFYALQSELRAEIARMSYGGGDGRVDEREREAINKQQRLLDNLDGAAKDSLSAAARLDPRLKGRGTPKVSDAFTYWFGYGRLAIIPAPR